MQTDIIELRQDVDELQKNSNSLIDKVRQLDDQVVTRIPTKQHKFQKDIEELRRKLELLEQQFEGLTEKMVSKKDFEALKLLVKSMKGTTFQEYKTMEKMHSSSMKQMKKTGKDIEKINEMARQQGRQVETLFKDNKDLRGSVNEVMEDVNLLDDVAKKAVSDLDTLYELDHRTRKHLNELEESIEQIKQVLERDENDRESKLGLKLEMIEKEVTKLFKFMCLLILAVGVVLFWCIWWQYRLYKNDPRFKYRPRYHSEL